MSAGRSRPHQPSHIRFSRGRSQGRCQRAVACLTNPSHIRRRRRAMSAAVARLTIPQRLRSLWQGLAGSRAGRSPFANQPMPPPPGGARPPSALLATLPEPRRHTATQTPQPLAVLAQHSPSTPMRHTALASQLLAHPSHTRPLPSSSSAPRQANRFRVLGGVRLRRPPKLGDGPRGGWSRSSTHRQRATGGRGGLTRRAAGGSRPGLPGPVRPPPSPPAGKRSWPSSPAPRT